MLAKPRPSVRYLYDSSAISRDGNCAIITEISSTIVHNFTACSKAATSKHAPAPVPLRKAIKLSEARLQAVSSRNMYSEHGLDARISPPEGQVCQSLIVVWNWMPGSAHAHAAQEIFSHSARAGNVLATPPPRNRSCHSSSSSTALRNPSFTRTELFEFWPDTER